MLSTGVLKAKWTKLPAVLEACERMTNHLTAAVVSNDPRFQDRVLGASVNGTQYVGQNYGAVYTGNPAKGGLHRGWVDVPQQKSLGHAIEAPPSDASTIQVLISAFRDDLCGRTLFNLFATAAFPDNTEGLALVEVEADVLDSGERLRNPPEQVAADREPDTQVLYRQ